MAREPAVNEQRRPAERSTDVTSLVVLSMLLVLVAAGILVWLSGHHAIFAYDIEKNEVFAYLIAFVLAGIVGGCELISRYRDSPWQAARGKPGLLYIGSNGGAGLVALFLIRHFKLNISLGLGDDLINMALAAGFGAMVIIRTKLFTVRQPGGGDVAVGPAFAVDTFLSAVNREVDRDRASERIQFVAKWARRLRDFQFAKAAPFLTTALAALQDLDAGDAQRLRDEFRALVEDARFIPYTDETKFFLAGFDIMTAFGENSFESLFTELERFMQQAPP
jgi:hypothetical protein